jgi:hypothetical protein
MDKKKLALAVILVLPGASPAQTTLSLGVDYAAGKYGEAETTRSYALPLSLKYENAPWTFKASVPLLRTEGTFSRALGVPSGDDSGGGGSGGGSDDEDLVPGTASQVQSGIGDLVLFALYNVLYTEDGFGLDVGVKAKLATADKKKTLLTSGENDYSIQAELFQSVGSVTYFTTLGFTRRGDRPDIDYLDPLYGTLGASWRASPSDSLGLAWDGRQKLTPAGDPISELSVFYSRKLDATDKVQFYLVRGFSDSSPDVGGGLVFSRRL